MVFRFARSKRRTRPNPDAMNKTEERYSQHLRTLLTAGEILDWRYGAVNFRLADKTYYKPDFAVMLPDGTLEFHEVKAGVKKGGYLCEDDAKVKIKVAAEQHWWFQFAIVFEQNKVWQKECFGAEKGRAP